MIPFNKPFLTGKETKYIQDVIASGRISGNGKFTHLCQNYFEQAYGFHKCLLATSCTDALEMAAILLKIKPGDEVIIPSYTFVSTANAFLLRGAKIVFADSMHLNPNIDATKLESLITDKTKAIVPVHYAGIACNMDLIMEIAIKYNLFVVEDAAQAIDSYHINKSGIKRPLGSFGHMATFSFHESKNITSGEGGMLVINDRKFARRAEIISEKGTNRSQFLRGEVNCYKWKDIGSSFLPSEILAAFLWAQIEHLGQIKFKRQKIWKLYHSKLKKLETEGFIRIPKIPKFSDGNAHIFFFYCRNINERDTLINFLKNQEITANFHYNSLHSSEFYYDKHDGRELINSEIFTNTLIRLPLYVELKQIEVNRIISKIYEFFNSK